MGFPATDCASHSMVPLLALLYETRSARNIRITSWQCFESFQHFQTSHLVARRYSRLSWKMSPVLSSSMPIALSQVYRRAENAGQSSIALGTPQIQQAFPSFETRRLITRVPALMLCQHEMPIGLGPRPHGACVSSSSVVELELNRAL